MEARPTYKKDDTYDSYAQDVIRILHEAVVRGATHVEIRHKNWDVAFDFPPADRSGV